MTLHQLEVAQVDAISIISLHVQVTGTTEPFRTPETSGRAINYYNAGTTGVPTTYTDGVIQRIGAQNYSVYLNDVNTRKAVTSPLTIELTGGYNSSSRTGVINAHITNTSESTVSGVLQCILTETNIAHSWGGLDSIFHVARDLIPDQNGEAISIAAGNSTDKSRSFTINSGWKPNDCYIVVFVQGSTKEIYQASKVKVSSIGIEENKQPSLISLKNEPNPFSNQMVISYYLPNTCKVSLEAYDITGKLIQTFVDRLEPTGLKEIMWDGKDSNGLEIPAGPYFIKLKAGEMELLKKVIHLK